MADNIQQDAMIQAGFTQAPPDGGSIVQPPTPFVQSPVVQQLSPVQVNQAPTVNTGTNVSPTTTVSGNDNVVSFSSMIQDNTGGTSSIRVLMLLWGVGVFLVWATAVIIGLFHGVYVIPSIPQTVVEILIGVTGIKTIQRFGEH